MLTIKAIANGAWRTFAILATVLAILSAAATCPEAKTKAVYVKTKDGRRAAFEGALFLRVPAPKGDYGAVAKKLTGDAKNEKAILAATPHKKGKRPAEARVPLDLLTAPYRLELLGALFPDDSRVPDGWIHVYKSGPMKGMDSWDSMASWFCSGSRPTQKIRAANKSAGERPKPGAKLLVPESILKREIRDLPQEGEPEKAQGPVEPPASGQAPKAKAKTAKEKVYGPQPKAPEAPEEIELEEQTPQPPVPKKPTPTPDPKRAEQAGAEPDKAPPKVEPPGKTADEKGQKAPALPVIELPPEPAQAPPQPPQLEYGKDAKGPYAIYRLQQKEALYSAVAARFTGRVSAADVNEMAFKIAERSEIADVTTIPIGFPVKIPLEDMLPEYLPKDDKRYKAWAKRKAEAGKFTNTYKNTALDGVVVILDSGHGGLDRGAMQNGVWEDSYVYDIACRINRGLESKTKARVLMTLHNPSFGYEPQDKKELEPNKGAVILTHPWYRPEENSESKFAVNLRWYLANQYFLRLRKEGVDQNRIVFTSIHADSLHPSLRGAMFYIAGSEYRRTRWSCGGAIYQQYEEYNASPSFSLSAKDLARSEGLSHQFSKCIEHSFKKASLPLNPYQPTRDHVVRGKGSWVPAVLRNSIIPCSILIEVCNLNNTEDAKLMKDPEYRQAVADAYIAALIKYYS